MLAILDDQMAPLLREGRTDEAVDAGVATIEDALRAGAPKPKPKRAEDGTIAGVMVATIIVLLGGAFALVATGKRRTRKTSSDVVHVPYVDAGSSGGGFSGSGGATSSW